MLEIVPTRFVTFFGLYWSRRELSERLDIALDSPTFPFDRGLQVKFQLQSIREIIPVADVREGISANRRPKS